MLNINKKQINIRGVPGAGKTTKIINLCKKIPNEKILYLSYGRENTKKSRDRLPKHVDAYSFHGFARKNLPFGTLNIVNNINLKTIQDQRKCDNLPLLEPKLLEAIVILLFKFIQSNKTLNNIQKLFNDSDFPKLSLTEKQVVITGTCQYWLATWKQKKPNVTHDMYLKWFSLINLKTHYSRVFIDETQDLTEPMFDIIDRIESNNPNTQTIYFGDPLQQIFDFRGSSKRFARTSFDENLTETYRFGVEVCHYINNLMNEQEVVNQTKIISKKRSKIHDIKNPKDCLKTFKQSQNIAYIARYNITLWKMLYFLSKNNLSYHIIGGFNKSEVLFLKNLHSFMINGRSKNKSFNGNYLDYRSRAKNGGDVGLYLACRFVESLKNEKNIIFDQLALGLKPINEADVILTTIHQAKGLEFVDVVLASDFKSPYEKGVVKILANDEFNMFYTAVTRVIKNLYLPIKYKK